MKSTICCCTLSLSLVASADDRIQIDFHSDADTHFAAPATAPPSKQGVLVNTAATTWNRITNMAGTPYNQGKTGYTFTRLPLKQADGTICGAEISGTIGYSSSNAIHWETKSKDDVMMAGWFGLRESESITVSNLPSVYAQGFTLVIYGDSNATNGRNMPYKVGATTKSLEDRENFSGTFREGANFVVFRGLTGSSFTINGPISVTAERSAINGLIILAGNRLP